MLQTNLNDISKFPLFFINKYAFLKIIKTTHEISMNKKEKIIKHNPLEIIEICDNIISEIKENIIIK